MRFRMDDYFGPMVDEPAPGQEILAAWICRDVNVWLRTLLDALAMIDQVANGDKPFQPWDSEGYEVAFDAAGVAIRSLHGDRRGATYSLPEVRSALEEYWSFLTALPERPDAADELHRWETTWDLNHPYRSRLAA